jgi:trans-2,3-dihydro-3-hydroxyanthranilate isomerase
MTQPLPEFHPPIDNPGLAASALGLREDEVTGTNLPVQVVSCGVAFLFVPVSTRKAVDRAAMHPPAYAELMRSAKAEVNGVFFFTTEQGHPAATVYSRMFAPDVGIAEDPATGIASGPLGCYLVRHNVVAPDRAGAMLSLQGVKMGRPSQVHMSIGSIGIPGMPGMPGSEITSVHVGGEAVLACEGTLYIP